MDQEVPHGQQPVMSQLEPHAFEFGSSLSSVGSLEKCKSRHIKQKWICQMSSFKRDPGKEGLLMEGKGKGRIHPKGVSLLHSALRGPGLCTSRGGVGLWKPTDCKRAQGTIFRVQGACLPVSFLHSDFLSPAGGKARLMRRSDCTQTRPASRRWQNTSSGSLELRTSGSLVGFFSGPGKTQTQPRGCARCVNTAEVCQEGAAGVPGIRRSQSLCAL